MTGLYLYATKRDSNIDTAVDKKIANGLLFRVEDKLFFLR